MIFSNYNKIIFFGVFLILSNPYCLAAPGWQDKCDFEQVVSQHSCRQQLTKYFKMKLEHSGSTEEISAAFEESRCMIANRKETKKLAANRWDHLFAFTEYCHPKSTICPGQSDLDANAPLSLIHGFCHKQTDITEGEWWRDLWDSLFEPI